MRSLKLLIPALMLSAVAALPRTASAQFYPYPAYGIPYDVTVSIRLEVTPKNTEVYVDGVRAGRVDDFAGFFQRIHIHPGQHELVLYLDGYRTVRQSFNLHPASDQKIRYAMVRLAPGETAEPRPQRPATAPEGQTISTPPPPAPPFPPYPGQPGPPPQPPQAAPGPVQTAEYGAVVFQVQPADAEILVDGNRWNGPSGHDRLVIQLAGGRHHVEIQKDGYDKYSSDIDVRPGDTLPLNVSLLRR